MGYVLVIERDATTRELVVDVLQTAGVAVEAVEDAVTALALIAQRPPALVLLDRMTAPMGEAAFIQAYRSLPGLSRPVLLFTAWNQAEEHARVIGADGVIRKPFELDAFLEIVQRYLGAA